MVELNREYLDKEYGKDDLVNLTNIEMKNKIFRKINSNAFKELTKLEILMMNFNAIEEIEVESFESLSNLKELHLDFNNLKRINSNVFKGLTKLEKLWLSNNVIEEIEVGAFESLYNLKWLYLYGNKLKRIDRKCFKPLESIIYIDLSDNDGFNYLSFEKGSNSIKNTLLNIVKKGAVSNWNQFLKQFPELEEAKKFQDPNIGLFLNDRYKVLKKLGSGSFGLVYLVDDTKIDIKRVKEKAMKIMERLDSATDNELELFMEINHDYIVRYFDHFHLDNKTFLITEYCQNGDLKNKIEETKRMGINFNDKQILDWIRQATNALNYLHSKNPNPIIHRDIKPANMLLSGKNEVKLGDLGLSKLLENTHASTHAGSPVYMSPEIFKAQFMDIKHYPNTDIWSLGCVLYELKILSIAFPIGQRGNPPIPSKVATCGIFSSILYEMLEKDCSVRITSQRLLDELKNISDNITNVF